LWLLKIPGGYPKSESDSGGSEKEGSEDGDDLEKGTIISLSMKNQEVKIEAKNPPKRRHQGPSVNFPKADGLDCDDGDVWNTSISSIGTVPVRQADAFTRYPDFARLGLTWTPSNHPRYDGYEIAQVFPHVLVEFKTCPSRSLPASLLENKINATLEDAQEGLSRQAALAFLGYNHLKGIMCIAAAGPYWNWAILKPNNITQKHWKEIETDENPFTPPLKYTKPEWSDFSRLKRPRSDAAYTMVRQKLQKLVGER